MRASEKSLVRYAIWENGGRACIEPDIYLFNSQHLVNLGFNLPPHIPPHF